jgi:hypothetical protein
MHPLAILQGQAANILPSISTEVALENNVEALKGRYVDQQLATAYRFQLKSETQLIAGTQLLG